ncbi:hypothetical protein CLAFUW4_06523 [Fulvia fulva]|uniref:Conserved oligomeric Golgi complex subunit 2 n=1 Tax=Passalora fulva TaxID=5499 RepID=A0A9Q8LJ40_PASFU|nr:uncharacterized protein CLAFUR5_06671 [Fulvia fulva]KAK4621315.1 hypothetical protein CLAFUR4_06531 [Fulvia fulva]KAK4622635.1 hypothetical protein CLAFUR0_06527 [Fulvia fulva]UJO18425.1 hypothetical protein CLAFUR5_06671 [Fulvia fulva]WPV16634.1 hypothetical protein CLAFUW4_06523 [Fulvia fulva]WPV31212.1 hypothetical protein CLAFUW7_06522 [Fulvia fulva]
MSSFELPSASLSPASTPAAAPSPDRYSSDDDDLDTLPYPGELPRNDFLAPDFDPQTYLSTLRNRHQTLEDLRSDLRQRSQLLNKELLDLVNGNYEEFLILGSDLKGGEEKVEGVRVGLLGFKREVEGIREGVRERAMEVKGLVDERKEVRRDVVLGRSLLEVGERLEGLERSLGISEGEDEEDVEEFEDEDEEGGEDVVRLNIPLKKLQRHAMEYVLVTRMMDRIGASHPFLVAQASRMEEISKTILLDLAAALRQAKAAKSSEAILAITKIYGDLGAEDEGVKALKAG